MTMIRIPLTPRITIAEFRVTFEDSKGIAILFMAAVCNRAGHYIFILWFLSIFFYLSFFPRLISAVAEWMITILAHMVWP